MLDNFDQFSLPELEKKVLKKWKKDGVFNKTLLKNKGKKQYVFYEGPPTANGRPGIHHVLARSFKDLMPRYKTMRGYDVPRKAGWDTHGLPVEIQAEKELGLTSKKEIEKYGIAKFNDYCRELVWRNREEFEAVTERMGYWVDMENPYVTYENSYIESLWWVISEINKRKLLYKGHRVAPWCTRCGTALSSHELAQGYKTKTSISVYVKFQAKKGQKIGKKFKADENTYFVSWTTTPWTLPGNAALYVLNKTKYSLVKKEGETLIVASSLLEEALLGEHDEVLGEVSGKDLIGLKYEQLFDVPALKNAKSHRVFAADFVTENDGTGIVHSAVMYGEDDYAIATKTGLPQHHIVLENGNYDKGAPGLSGKNVHDEKTIFAILKILKSRGVLVRKQAYKHEYPHCWRCSSPLLYYARTSWFVGMSKLKKELLANNEKINWTPKHIKKGRFGGWLSDVKDWNFSRARYWGTPLPVWECAKRGCSNTHVASSIADLKKNRASTNTYFGLRHGEAQHNVDGVIASGKEGRNTTSKLTARGEEQVEALAKKLKKEKIDVIISSPYFRTKKTAEIIKKATGAKLVTDKRIEELNVGVYNWKKHDAYHDFFKNNLDRFTTKPKGGESLNELKERLVGFIKDIDTKYKNKKILIVSHGDPLWILEGILRGATKPEELLASTYYPGHETYTYHEFEPLHLPYTKGGDFDLHRPHIDSLKLRCTKAKCNGEMERISEVCDVWFDSGAMPFAQDHFPFDQTKSGAVPTGKALEATYKKISFPADYISEAIDQTRGWFYTLLAVSTLLKKPSPYKNVVCLGLVHDKDGIKMSKSKGNIILPLPTMNTYGADVVRWHFYTMNNPGDAKNFDEEDLKKVTRRFIMTMYNTYVFWKTYGSTDPIAAEKFKPKHVLDRWIMSRMSEVGIAVTKRLEKYEMGEAGRILEDFVSDLSRWYIRRSRSRFQEAARGDVTREQDWREASMTLQLVLSTLSKLIAPFTPFFAEGLYQAVDGSKESVHLEEWPMFSGKDVDKDVLSDMEAVRGVAAKVLALRATHGLKVRQPLASLSIKDMQLRGKKDLLEVLMDEVNVRTIKFSAALKAEDGLVLDTKITQDLEEEGIIRELARMIQSLRADAKYEMSDEIVLMIAAPEDLMSLIQRRNVALKRMVNAKSIELHIAKKHDAYKKVSLKDWELELAVRKL